MIKFFVSLLPILDPRAKRRLLVAMLTMAFLSIFEGIGLLLMLPLLELATSGGKSQTSATRFISRVLGESGTHLEIVLAVSVLAVFIFKDIAAVALTRWNVSFSLKNDVAMLKRLMLGYLEAPYRFHLDRNTADMQRTLSYSVRQIFEASLIWAFGALGDIVAVAIIAVALLIANPVIAAISAAYFTGVVVIYQRLISKKMDRSAKAQHVANAASLKLMAQSLQVAKELKILHRETEMAEEVGQLFDDLMPHVKATNLASIQPRYYLELALLGATGLIALVSSKTEGASQAIALIGVFLAGGFRLLAPLNKVFTGRIQARLAIPAIEQVSEDLKAIEQTERPVRVRYGHDEKSMITASSTGTDAGAIPVPDQNANSVISRNPTITVSGVTFSYVAGRQVLSGVSLAAEPGSAIALVGGSGAGKSTLLDLMLGLLEPDSGEIEIDGKSLSDPSARYAWQSKIGYVPQTISLIDDTVSANIALGVPPGQVDQERLAKAVENAELGELIASLPDGLNAVVGERGVRLSGGQRQRLGIARALYNDPSVLFLDEATSALDNSTEASISETLRALKGSMTVITVAHRLSTIRDSDRIYFMEAGAIVGSGTFTELMTDNAGFRKLVELAKLPGGTEETNPEASREDPSVLNEDTDDTRKPRSLRAL